MSDFKTWCDETETAISTNKLLLLTADPAKQQNAAKGIAKSLPDYYASPNRIAGLLKQLGRPAVAKYIEEKLPTLKTIKSGDLGEILCNGYVIEATKFKLGIKRLRWKDHRNMSMRGEDVLAFSMGPKGDTLTILKAEVKSRAAMPTAVIEEARVALAGNMELPSPHAISFVADRLDEAGDWKLRDALDKAQLKDGLKVSQITHMLFTFSERLRRRSPPVRTTASLREAKIPRLPAGVVHLLPLRGSEARRGRAAQIAYDQLVGQCSAWKAALYEQSVVPVQPGSR